MGAHKKKLAFESNSSSTSSQSDHNGAYMEKHAATRRREKGKTLSALSGRGIGLHLNALTAARMAKLSFLNLLLVVMCLIFGGPNYSKFIC
jgi:hypothetical protein